MMDHRLRGLGAGAVLAGLALLTWWVSPNPQVLAALLAHPQSAVERVGVDGAVASLVAGICWLLLGWLALGFSCCAAGALPGVLGRGGRAASRRLLPAALRHAAAVALGVSVVTSGGPATAAVTPGAHGGGPVAAVTVTRQPVRPTPAGVDFPVDWPARSSAVPVPGRRTVVVAPGECLWDLAAAQLGRGASNARIATEWQRWYAANRTVIGPDPDLIHPGQRLVSPEPHRTDRRDQR